MLMDADLKWIDFKWFLTVVTAGFTLDRYRQLARIQNMRHCPFFYLYFTYTDTLLNLRMEFERPKQNGGRLSAADVAFAYDVRSRARSP